MQDLFDVRPPHGCDPVGQNPIDFIAVSAALLFSVTFGLKSGADAQAEMAERDKDFFGKK